MIDITQLSITVVEPSVTQGKIIINKLSTLGATMAQYYPNGQMALEFIDKFRPDLVISAMYLSDMTGTDLVLTMRGSPSMADIPFMLITSENSLQVLDPIKQAGAVAVLPKPFELKDLENALYSTVDILSNDEDFVDEYAWEEMKVLVVDDSPLAQRMVCKVLGNIGITNIDLAFNGKEAVTFIANNYYDLIVTDFNMPEMDGQALITYIRESSNQQTVPILMITSEQDEARLAAVHNAGVSGICDKPFDSRTFKKLIARFIVGQDK